MCFPVPKYCIRIPKAADTLLFACTKILSINGPYPSRLNPDK